MPPSVPVRRLRSAAYRMAKIFGLPRLNLVVSDVDEDEGTLGRCFTVNNDHMVTLYDHNIRREARGWRTVRRIYAIALVHEMTHVSQHQRGSTWFLSEKIRDAEARAMERVYGKMVEDILKGD